MGAALLLALRTKVESRIAMILYGSGGGRGLFQVVGSRKYAFSERGVCKDQALISCFQKRVLSK